MSRPASLFIEGCWIAWILYWVAMAFHTKRTVERAGFLGYRLVGIVLAMVLLIVARLTDVNLNTRLWHPTLALGVVCDCIVLCGAAFTVWARITLGRNWSAEVTFKQDHELIESGPYALARHPIYTGLIAMGVGTAVDDGRVVAFGVLVAICGALWWKAREEEGVMRRHFPAAYAEYKARVHAIIPFVL